MSERDHVALCNAYIKSVQTGKRPACKWEKLAVKRHLDDLKRAKRKSWGYVFDPAPAIRACTFFELLPHIKGRWARPDPQNPDADKLRLEPWQVFILFMLFGWIRRATGMRRFWRALFLVSRKNGKSDFAARLGLYMLAADREVGAEIYCGATSKKQAYEVFGPAQKMALRTEDFLETYEAEVHPANINLPDGSKFEPVIGNPGEGPSPSCAIIDEYHEHQTDRQADAMETGVGAREQPLVLYISTAGENLAGPCYALMLDAQHVLQRTVVNEEFFAIIFTIDEKDDWTSDRALAKANPNIGVSVSKEFLKRQIREAKGSPRKQARVKTRHLNMWVSAMNAYFHIEAWNTKCENKKLALEQFYGKRCIVGLDLASKIDIASKVYLFPPPGDGDKYRIFGVHYLPEETVALKENDAYRAWHKEGWLTVTDGQLIDFNLIRDQIKEDVSKFELAEVAYDPHQATMLVNQLMEEKIPCVEFRPTVLNFSDPMKTLDGLIRAGELEHNGDPVLTWMFSNVVAKEDKKDNVYPNKPTARQKIDGVISTIMALGRHLADEAPSMSVYEKRGFATT